MAAVPQLKQAGSRAEAEAELVELSACPEGEGLQLYPHPKYCDQFYKCANGTLTLEFCENGLLFDGKGAVYNYCNYHWGVDCGKRVSESEQPHRWADELDESRFVPSLYSRGDQEHGVPVPLRHLPDRHVELRHFVLQVCLRDPGDAALSAGPGLRQQDPPVQLAGPHAELRPGK